MNNFINVALLKFVEDAKVPVYVHNGDAGCDLCSIEEYVIAPLEIKLVGTGIGVALPYGVEAQVRPRSGLAIKKGLTVINSPGTIDSNYRGEIKVGLVNLGKEVVVINKYDRIAQLVIAPVYRGVFYAVDSLPETDRGDGGFGHTGIK